MNKHSLECFMEIYRQRNIQAAADNLYISHQGLSRVLNSLEKELGQSLFRRTNRGVVPTDFATKMIPHAEAILGSYERIEVMQLQADMSEASVMLYAMDHIPGCLGTQFFVDFKNRYPDIAMTITESTDEGAVDALRSKRADLAISDDSVFDSRIEREFLFRSRPCVRMSASNPLASKKVISLEDLDGCSIAGKGREYRCFRKHLEQMIFGRVIHLDIFLETSDERILDELAAQDKALVLTYDYSAMQNKGTDTVIRYLEGHDSGDEFYLMRRLRHELPRLAQLLWDYFIEWRDMNDRFTFA